MKNPLRKIIAFSLLLVMVFSISATTAFAIGETEDTGSNGVSNTLTPSGGGTSTSGGVDLGWCSIQYDNNSLDIVWYHNPASLFSASVEQLKMLKDQLAAGLKAIVVENAKEGITGLQPGESADPSLNSFNAIMSHCLEKFVDEKVGGHELTDYVELFKLMLSNTPEGDAVINEFVDKICTLVTAAVHADVVSIEDLPEPENVAELVEDTINEYIDSYVTVYVEEHIKEYIEYLAIPENERGPITDDLLLLVQSAAVLFVRNEVTSYIDGSHPYFENEIKSFVDVMISEHIADTIESYLDHKCNGTLPTGQNELYAYNLIDAYFEGSIDNYIDLKLGGTVSSGNQTALDQKITEIADKYVRLHVDAQIDAYVDYMYHNSTVKPAYFDIIDRVVKAEIASFGDPGITYDNFTALIGSTEFKTQTHNYLNSNPDSIFSGIEESDLDLVLSNHSELLSESKADLLAFVEANESSIIEQISLTVDPTSEDYKNVCKSMLASVSDDEIIAMLSDAVEQTSDIDSLVDDINDHIFGNIDQSYKNTAIAQFIGMEIDEYTNSLELLILVVSDKYEILIADLEDNENTDVGYDVLVECLESVKVRYNDNLEKVLCETENGVLEFKKDALLALIAELPAPSQLANMPDDEMKFSWAVEAVTTLSDNPICFNINLSVGSGYAELRELARAIASMVEFYKTSNGKTVIKAEMPDCVTDIIYSVFSSNDIDPALRREFFSLYSMSVDEIYDYFINDFTYRDYISVVKTVDFELLLEEFGIDDISNARVRGRISNENYFNKFKSLVKKVYKYVPSDKTDLTVMNFYKDNGTLGTSGKYTFDISSLIEKVAGSYSGFITDLFDDTVVEIDASVSVNFERFHSVEYVVNGTTQAVGLLPEGADLAFFYGSDRYEGYKILSWSDGEDTVCTEMPNHDVVLNATLEELEITLLDEENKTYVNKTYDGVASTLTVSVEYTEVNPTYTYKWYKNGALIEGANTSSIQVVNVADNGTYYCVVDVVDGELSTTLTSNTVIVEISPMPKTLADYPEIVWSYTGTPFVYNKAPHSVSISENYADIELASLIGQSATNAGDYTAAASFRMLNQNYCFADSATLYLNWKINPAEITNDDVTFVWDYNPETPFVYEYGNVRKISLTVPENLKATVSGDTATEAGEYVAMAAITSSNPNYVWVGTPMVSCTWKIEKATVDLTAVAWDYTEETKFVYTGLANKVSVVGLPSDIVLVYSENEKVNAGTYTATVNYDPNAPANTNYTFVGTVPACEWTVEKATITDILENYSWSYTADTKLVYNGAPYTVTLNVPDGVGVVVNYTGNVAIDAGKYTASAVLVPYDSENFVIDGNVNYSLEWTVEKAEYDMTGITFEDKTVYYNGSAQGIFVTGELPEGVKVSYTQSPIEPGKYEIVAKFEGDANNYLPITDMTATLTILPVYTYDREFSKYDSDGNLVASITAANGILSNHTLNVKDVIASYAYQDFGNMFGEGKNGKVISVYDIHFAVDGIANTVNDVFEVTLAIPKDFAGVQNNLRVVYIAENGELVDMEAIISDGALVYETTHFSVYAIVEVIDRVQEKVPVDLTWLIILLVCLFILAVLVLILLYIIKKRRNPEEPISEAEPEPTEPEPEIEEEAPVEEAPVEEAPAEEAPVEEAPAEEAPEEPKISKPDFAILPDGATVAINGVVVPARYRSSFMSRLIQSEPPIQDYYNVLKNALLSYKGVKARMSWNCESFNKGRVQCAKLNVKGRTFLVYLGLNLDEYNVNKYHFSDASDKPKFEKVPMMLKIKSERGLKYALELIDEVMSKNGIERGKESNEDFHMPYASTFELVRRDLVKLILPPGVTLSDGMLLSNTNVGAMLDEVNAASQEKTKEE